jgi:hypothetical protein
MKLLKAIVWTAFYLGISPHSFAAEFPVYYECDSNVQNMVTMRTFSKEWHFDPKSRRIDGSVSTGVRSSHFSDILVDGVLYHVDHDKKTIRSRPLLLEERSTLVHEFTPASLAAAGMKLLRSEKFEGEDCDIYVGNVVKKVVEKNADAKKKMQGVSSNLLDTFASVFWIRKSDGRLIRNLLKVGSTGSVSMTARKISSNPALFDRSMLKLPSGYQVLADKSGPSASK